MCNYDGCFNMLIICIIQDMLSDYIDKVAFFSKFTLGEAEVDEYINFIIHTPLYKYRY